MTVSSLSDDGAYASLGGLEGSTQNGHQYKRGSKLNESTSYPIVAKRPYLIYTYVADLATILSSAIAISNPLPCLLPKLPLPSPPPPPTDPRARAHACCQILHKSKSSQAQSPYPCFRRGPSIYYITSSATFQQENIFGCE